MADARSSARRRVSTWSASVGRSLDRDPCGTAIWGLSIRGRRASERRPESPAKMPTRQACATLLWRRVRRWRVAMLQASEAGFQTRLATSRRPRCQQRRRPRYPQKPSMLDSVLHGRCSKPRRQPSALHRPPSVTRKFPAYIAGQLISRLMLLHALSPYWVPARPSSWNIAVAFSRYCSSSALLLSAHPLPPSADMLRPSEPLVAGCPAPHLSASTMRAPVASGLSLAWYRLDRPSPVPRDHTAAMGSAQGSG